MEFIPGIENVDGCVFFYKIQNELFIFSNMFEILANFVMKRMIPWFISFIFILFLHACLHL